MFYTFHPRLVVDLASALTRSAPLLEPYEFVEHPSVSFNNAWRKVFFETAPLFALPVQTITVPADHTVHTREVIPDGLGVQPIGQKGSDPWGVRNFHAM